MSSNTRLILFSCISGCFVLFDQLLKYVARTNPDTTYFPLPYVGWEYFRNPGIAFSLPFPNILLVIATPIVVLFLFLLLIRQHKKQANPWFSFGLLLIIGGAISNYIDRVIFEVTIDYLRILTGIINIGDVMIVVGAGLLVVSERKKPFSSLDKK